MSFFMSDAVRILKSENLPATPAKIRYGVLLGRIPRPPVNSLGFWEFTREDLPAIRLYLEHPPDRTKRPRRVVTA